MEELSMDLLNNLSDGVIDIDIKEDDLEFTPMSKAETPPDDKSADVDPDGIFGNPKGSEEKQESGSTDDGESPEEEDNPESSSGEDVTTKAGDKTSPNDTPILASVAKACYEDGIFPDLSEDDIAAIKDGEGFAAAIKKQIEAGLDAEQRKLKEMLNIGVTPDEIQHYEGTINYLASIKEEDIEADNEEAESLRKKLIYNDFLNRGFKAERAQREMERSINAGTDLEDAKAALESCIDFYKEKYTDLVEARKDEAERARKAREKELKEFKERVLNTDKPFDGLSLDKMTREKVFNNMTKATYKSEEGELLTPIQKYIRDNNLDAHYYLSLMYTITDGFKNIDKLVNQKLKTAKKSAIRELEHTLNNTRRMDDGSIDFNQKPEEDSFDIVDAIGSSW